MVILQVHDIEESILNVVYSNDDHLTILDYWLLLV